MTSFSELSSVWSVAIRNENLLALATEPGEQIIDSLLADGVLRDIPILGQIYSVCKIGGNIRDWLFCKKLVCFLSEIADVPATDRAALISALDQDNKYQIKVGEKLLYILDKSDDHETARIVAHLFAACLSGDLSYDEFLRASRAVQSVMIVDLWEFVAQDKEVWDIWDVHDLLNSGLIAFNGQEIEVRDYDSGSWKDTKRYEVLDGELTASITTLGEKVRTILRSHRGKMSQPV